MKGETVKQLNLSLTEVAGSTAMLQYWEKFMWDKISQMFLLGSLSGIAVLGDVIREYLLVNLIVLFVFVNMGIILIRMYLRKKFDCM